MKTDDFEELYVGYMPSAPKSVSSFLRFRIAMLLILPLAIAALIAATQGRFGPGTFEYGQYQTFTGTLFLSPHPMLRLDRPGQVGDLPEHSLYYLGVFGKHGAMDATRGHNFKRVSLRGALIYRDNQVMIEMEDGSLDVLGDAERPEDNLMGSITVSGEIVDSKCFLGVMKPGNLKTHKVCAIRCISSGIPPVLLVRDTHGNAHYFLLADADGSAIHEKVLDMVAEPIQITGEVYQRDNLFLLRADPKTYKRLHP